MQKVGVLIAEVLCREGGIRDDEIYEEACSRVRVP